MKGKAPSSRQARDLYVSPLWKARRSYAEASQKPWFILSAEYGLLEPGREVAPYDVTLAELTAKQRRDWALDVVASLEARLGSLHGIQFEIHAGSLYRRWLEPELGSRGALTDCPLAGVAGIGNQIAWYRREMTARERRRRTTPTGVEQALDALERRPQIVGASAFPGKLADLDQPGLYAWWADSDGAAALAGGLHRQLAPGRIYVGLTGATKWPSGSRGKQTLRTRIGRNHVNGRIGGSTFRLTLASILARQLELQVMAPLRLAPESERRLSDWMRAHLSVAVHPYPDADALADLEERVLEHLNPPLNLEAVTSTNLRERLSELRRRLKAGPVTRIDTAIGNGLEGYFRVVGDGHQLSWEGPDRRTGSTHRSISNPAPADWNHFWEEVDRLRVWEWDGARYLTPDVLDGTFWTIDLAHEQDWCSTSGANGYPDSSGPDPSPRFNEFCAAVSKLAGDRTFR